MDYFLCRRTETAKKVPRKSSEQRKEDKVTKAEMMKAKEKVYGNLYERLDTKEEETDLYQLARQRD